MKIEAKLWPLEGEQGFKGIRPSDLVFDLTWPIFRSDWDMMIEANLWPVEGEKIF